MRYTANGHSHDKIKNDVEILVKKTSLDETEARSKVSKDAGYGSWREMMDEATNQERDNFFAYYFEHVDVLNEYYLIWLEGRPESDDNYREFLASHYEYMMSLGYKNVTSEGLKINLFEISSKLDELIKSNSPELLLPSSMEGSLVLQLSLLVEHVYEMTEPSSQELLILFQQLDYMVIMLFTAYRLVNENKEETAPIEFNIEISKEDVEYARSIYFNELNLWSLAQRINQNPIKAKISNFFDEGRKIGLVSH